MKELTFGHCAGCDKKIASVNNNGKVTKEKDYHIQVFGLKNTYNSQNSKESRMRVALCSKCYNGCSDELKQYILDRHIQTWVAEVKRSEKFTLEEKEKYKQYYESFNIK